MHSSPWWSTFFSGLALDAQRQMYLDEQTSRAEADFLLKALELSRGSRVLDVPCGTGRHSVELASRGIAVTGVDLTPEILEDARLRAKDRNVEVTFEAREMRGLSWNAEFDGLFCFGNSFGYLDDQGNLGFLRAAHRALKPGGRIAIEAPLVAEVCLPSFLVRDWYRLGEIFFLRNPSYDHEQSRFETEYTLLKDGQVEVKTASYRVYTYRELRELFEEVGFTRVEAFGALSGEPFKMGSKNCYFVARKA